MVKIIDFLLVALGGALGALGRWIISDYVQRLVGPFFPWGTLTVNVAGSFLLGFVATTAIHGFLTREERLFIAAGFAGGFTTFSTFSYETYMLAVEYSAAYALANVLLNVVLGLSAIYLGHMHAVAVIERNAIRFS